MKLRHQLFLVSLLLLTLPWAGCQYLQAVDVALRDLQTSSLKTNAQSIADRLVSQPELFNAPYVNASKGSLPLYVTNLKSRPIVDGYQDDWRAYAVSKKRVNEHNMSVTLRLGEYASEVYFFIEVTDNHLAYYNPSNGQDLSADHIVLTFYQANVSQEGASDKEIYLYTSSPGNVSARYRDSTGRIRSINTVKGIWRESASGYQLELEIDKTLLKSGFNLDVVDYRAPNENRLFLSDLLYQADSVKLKEEQEKIEQEKKEQQVLTRKVAYDKIELISLSERIEKEIRSLRLGDVSAYVLNKQYYLVAETEAVDGVVDPRKIKQNNKTPWFVEWIYKKALHIDSLPLRSRFFNGGQWQTDIMGEEGEEGEESKEDKPHPEVKSFWYRIPGRTVSDKTALSVLMPLKEENETIGFLVLEKTTDQLVALTNSAFNRLFLYTFAIFLLLVIGLIFYASWLSWRISRLNRCANTIVADNGLIALESHIWPELKSNDELGELSRSYRKLLSRLRENQDYLRDLSSKLSHELRTPIAIVKSSLDNLADIADSETLSAQQSQYQLRAKEGIERLSHILNSMSAANRIEESMAGAEFTQTRLKDFLSALTEMYQDIYPEYGIHFIADVDPEPLGLSQELFVQMMDKLLDNAVSFSEVEHPIIIRLSADKEIVTVAVENKGPLLPEPMKGRLFDSMVSLRQGLADHGKVHLGLGLYVVRMIAELHEGEVLADNHSDGKGVTFSVRLVNNTAHH